MIAHRKALMLAAAFVFSRGLLYVLRFPFEFELDWMWLPDTKLLEEELWKSLVWMHAFPPGMALIAGALLKLGHSHAFARMLFSGFGLLLTLSMFWLGKRLVRSEWTAWVVAFAFSLTPPTIFLEHLFLYDSPTAALLCLAALMFTRAVEISSAARWFAFGGVVTIIGFIRSAFHPAWLITLLVLSVFLGSGRRIHRAAALLPATLLIGWMFKNAVMFGFFGLTSSSGGNLAAITTQQLSPQERAELKLSRFAELSVFAAPSAYEVETPDDLPPQVSSLTKSNGSGNFNHWLFLEVNAARREDAMTYLRDRPGDYLKTVFTRSVPQFFGATTRWHPRDGRGGPHERHREVLGGWESTFETIVHPFMPFGLYVFVPIVFVLACRKTWRAHRSGDRSRAALGAFCLLHITVLTAASCMFTFGEFARYRLMIEPMLWLMTMWVISKAPQRSDELRGGV